MSNGASGEAILSAQGIIKSYGSQPVLQDVSLTVHEGERLGLIGRNGCGKSTLLKILAGIETPDDGIVTRQQGLRVGLLNQDCWLGSGGTVAEVLDQACREIRALLDEYDVVAHRLAQVPPEDREHARLQARYAALRHELEITGAWDLAVEIGKVATALDLPDSARTIDTLSGGELRRVGLAAAILGHPDVLLLDEPTNHIDTKSVEWIETFLAGYRGSCVLVTHDRYFLEQIVSRIVEIEFRRLYSFPGNYARFLEHKTQIELTEARTELGRQGVLRRELSWLRRGPKARSTKQRARINRYEEMASQTGPESHVEIAFELPEAPRLSKRVLDVEHVSFAYGDHVLFKDFSVIVQKGMRIGVLGPNGCGKTTLLRVMMGEEEPKKGRVLIGECTEFLYVDQTHSEINTEKTILDFVSGGSNYWDVNGRHLYVPAYLERFLFDMDSVHMPMRNLSGGERNRIELAKKLLRGGNFLVLDEPTNDLDLPTLRVLEEAILAFDGCALVVSHDRYFLNRVCTHVVAFNPGGELVFLAGSYDDYLLYRERHRETVAAGAKPKADAKIAERNPLRLTYKERQELAGIETAVETAEAEVARLEGVIGALGFYEQEYPRVQATLAALSAAKKRVEELYARWQELHQRQDIK